MYSFLSFFQRAIARFIGSPGYLSRGFLTALAGTALVGVSLMLGVLAGVFPSGEVSSPLLVGVLSILMIAVIGQFFAGIKPLSYFMESNLEARPRHYGRKLTALISTMTISYLAALILLDKAFTPGFTPSLSFLALWFLAALLPFAALPLLRLAFSGRGRALVLRVMEWARVLFRGRVL
jgi:hypothetical protein